MALLQSRVNASSMGSNCSVIGRCHHGAPLMKARTSVPTLASIALAGNKVDATDDRSSRRSD